MEGEEIMKRIEFRMVAGFLAAAFGFGSIGFAAAADKDDNTGRIPAKSPAANAPLIARVVVTPSPEQLAKIRLEKRMIGLENRATAGQQAGNGHTAATGAL